LGGLKCQEAHHLTGVFVHQCVRIIDPHLALGTTVEREAHGSVFEFLDQECFPVRAIQYTVEQEITRSARRLAKLKACFGR
jgi:hypothetical protein